MILWRPVGLAELALIFDSDMRAFPQRMPEQPIFYPVLDRDYAVQIAHDWNTKEPPFAGYDLRFEVSDSFASEFDVHRGGGSARREFWVPAEQLGEFNRDILHPIVAEQGFFGLDFRGAVPDKFGLKGRDAFAQITAMIGTLNYSSFDFAMEISANRRTIFLNYPFWKAAGPDRLKVQEPALLRCLDAIRAWWDFSPKPAPLIEDAAMTG